MVVMIKFHSIWFVYFFYITLITANHRTNYQFVKKNNNNLRQCLSSLLPESVRTVYPCNTLINQKNSEYQCDRFNVSELSSMRGARIPHSPAVIVYATHSSDVQHVMICATKLNYIVNALSGGHSYEGYGLGSTYNNIVINMGAINHIDINPHDEIGRFGTGVRIGPMYYTTYQYDNYTINAGTCPWMGLGGHALGGGYGLLARKYGLLADNILEMKAVNAQGDLLTINKTHEPELFWALRGGGGGLFVIVTEFKLRLIKSPSLVTQFHSIWPSNVTKQVMQQFQSILFDKTLHLSNDIFITMTVSNVQVEVTIIYYGIELEEFDRIVLLLLEGLPTPNKTDIYKQDWLNFVYDKSSIGDNNRDHRKLLLKNLTYPSYYFKAKHLFYDQPISDDSLDEFIDQLASGTGKIFAVFNPWDGYLNTIPVDKTAFPHRRYKFGIQFMVYWDDETQQEQQMHWLKQVYLTIYNDSTHHSYVNYMDRDVQNWTNVYYHTNEERLRRIKHIYDKDNRFYFERTLE